MTDLPIDHIAVERMAHVRHRERHQERIATLIARYPVAGV